MNIMQIIETIVHNKLAHTRMTISLGGRQYFFTYMDNK